MHKILLIIKREYFSRVKKKSFLLVTFLVPVLFIGMFSLIVYLAASQGGLGDKKKVEVVDESGWFAGKLKGGKTIEYSVAGDYATAKKEFLKSGYDYLLYIPATVTNIQLFGEKTPSAMHSGKIEEELSRIAVARRLGDAHIDSAMLAGAQKQVSVEPKQITENGEKDAHIYAAYGVGLACAFLIYMSLFLYGAQVMRGVIEEKVSRIIEVIISSVKPFQLMLGKIIGVGMVGLTQFVLWIALTMLLSTVAGTALTGNKGKAMQQIQQSQGMSEQIGGNGAHQTEITAATDNPVASLMASLDSLPVTQIVLCFLFYFFFGYMLYSALFAAVGSAVDNETETQQFILPVTLPLIFTIILSQTVIVNNPDSALSIWLSMIPFTAPIAMMIRIPFHVPPIQIAASMLLMVLGFLVTTWVAARIYRVGILMYGKKASYKELAKWFMYKE
ncbi:MAG: ABC transporter permease [Taibaiella sp.]|nr:ABC transporter permease [Taibaiella sp.]